MKSTKPNDIVLTKAELIKRAKLSNKQIKKSQVLSQNELETQSKMSPKQKSEIDKRSKLYKQGKLKTSTWSEVKKRTRLK